MVPVFVYEVTLCALVLGAVQCGEQQSQFNMNQLTAAWKSLNLTEEPRPTTEQTSTTTCPGCVSSRTNIESALTNSEITTLRIEYIKQQILKKLRLKEPPRVKKSSAKLPESLIRQAVTSRAAGGKQNDDEIYDDFYGKTDQVILFPHEGSNMKCEDDEDFPSVCLPFTLPSELQADEVTNAELWLYQTSAEDDFVVYEIVNSRTRREANMKDGWVKFDITPNVKSWLEFRELSHTLNILCTTCNKSSDTPLFLEREYKPFILITTDALSKSRRLKRNMSCAPGMTECCREELYISFADIGWDDWILQPHGYNAYFCRGSCTSPASLTNSGSHYNTVIRKLLYEKQDRGQKLELVPCCTASHLSSVQLLYVDSNNTVTKKTLPNMVVDSCGCM